MLERNSRTPNDASAAARAIMRRGAVVMASLSLMASSAVASFAVADEAEFEECPAAQVEVLPVDDMAAVVGDQEADTAEPFIAEEPVDVVDDSLDFTAEGFEPEMPAPEDVVDKAVDATVPVEELQPIQEVGAAVVDEVTSEEDGSLEGQAAPEGEGAIEEQVAPEDEGALEEQITLDEECQPSLSDGDATVSEPSDVAEPSSPDPVDAPLVDETAILEEEPFAAPLEEAEEVAAPDEALPVGETDDASPTTGEGQDRLVDDTNVENVEAESVAEDAPAPEAATETDKPSSEAPKADGAESTALLAPGTPSGWVTEDGKVKYYKGGKAVTGRQKIDGTWYYFSPDTSERISSKFVWHDAQGMVAHYDSKGRIQYGEQNIYGYLYYFNPSSGARTDSSFVYQPVENKTTYHDSLGHALVGEQTIGGDEYYFEPGTAARTESDFVTSSGYTYYYGSNGKKVHGEQTIGGVKHYFTYGSGALYKKGYQNPAGMFQVSIFNVSLPYGYENYPFNYVTPSRISVGATRSDCVETMISTAWDYYGTGYVWDYSCAPGVGVDCAGLVMQCLYSTGINLGTDYNPYDHFYTPGHNHYANDMSGDSRFQWVSLGNRQRGDLVFYPGHVAIYLGSDQIIEAYPGYVQTNSIWTHGTPTVIRRVFA